MNRRIVVMLIVLCILVLSMFACRFGNVVDIDTTYSLTEEQKLEGTLDAWAESGVVCDQHGRNCTLPEVP